MKPQNLILRCYANKDGDQWQIFCIDLCLAAQADSLKEAMTKMRSMISEYVYDALNGEDSAYAAQLMNRKAPFSQVATYYIYKCMHKIGQFKDGVHRAFKIPIPMIPSDYASN